MSTNSFDLRIALLSTFSIQLTRRLGAAQTQPHRQCTKPGLAPSFDVPVPLLFPQIRRNGQKVDEEKVDRSKNGNREPDLSTLYLLLSTLSALRRPTF